MYRILKVFALVWNLAILVHYGSSQPCGGEQDFAVKYSGGTVFTVASANNTCICPYFQGNGTYLSIDQNEYVRNLTARIASVESRVASLELKTGGLYVAQLINSNCLDSVGSSDCTPPLICSSLKLRCLLPAGAGCNMTSQCADNMICSSSICVRPFASCAAVLSFNPSSASGVYNLLLNGVFVPVYCDMTRSGGGWNLVLNVNTSDGNIVHHDNTAFWVSDTLVGGAQVNAANGLMTDYKHLPMYTSFPVSQLMILVHKAGATQFYRAWNMAVTGVVRSWFNRADGVNYQLTSAAIDTYFPGGSFANDPVISSNANEQIFANTMTSSYGNDFNRLSRAPDAGSDNCGWGIGTKYDTNSAAYSRPWADAIAKICGTWTNGFIGTDIMPGNGYGSSAGHPVAYAIFVR